MDKKKKRLCLCINEEKKSGFFGRFKKNKYFKIKKFLF